MKWKAIRDIFFKWLKRRSVKLALKKILGSAMMGGVQSWIITYVAEYLFDEYAVPLMKRLERQGLFYYDVNQGRIEYKKLENAKENDDKDKYNDIIDNA